jgi:hypothetical protein
MEIDFEEFSKNYSFSHKTIIYQSTNCTVYRCYKNDDKQTNYALKVLNSENVIEEVRQ